jgi:hypothetical protein
METKHKASKKRINLRIFAQKHKKALILSASVVMVILASSVTVALLFFNNNTSKADTSTDIVEPQPIEPIPEPIVYFSPLTGRIVDSEIATKAPVTGVMIENSPDARPQSGLKNSGVVFEAIAEGGITRFLVLYQNEKPQIIGPVRSLRLYDVDWLAAFDASIAHVGGSASALREIRNGTYRDLDQFFNSSYYWRSTDRYAPHNVYTNFEKLDALNSAKGYNSSSFTGFPRADGAPSQVLDATNIFVTISSDLYNHSYAFDATTNTYIRSQAGAKHADREDGQIAPSVVIVMKVNQTTVFEDGNREQITTIGSGEAYIFQNGTVTSGTWHKDSLKGQIYYKDSTGTPVSLNRGQTWITAVPNSRGGVSWQ